MTCDFLSGKNREDEFGGNYKFIDEIISTYILFYFIYVSELH